MKKIIIQRLGLIAADFISIFLSLFIALNISSLYHGVEIDYSLLHLGTSKLLGILIIIIFIVQEQYVRRRPFWEELRLIYLTIGAFTVLHLGLSFILAKLSLKILTISFWGSLALILPFCRIVIKLVLIKLDYWQRDLYIIANRDGVSKVYTLFINNKLLGYKAKGIVDISSSNVKKKMLSYEELIEKLKNNSCSEVIIALNNNEINKHLTKINRLQQDCLYLSILPDWVGLSLYGAKVDHFFGNDQLILRLNNNLNSIINIVIKTAFDYTFASLAIIFLSPLLIMIAILIKITTKTKIFYFHKRIGKHGKPFYCIKFQTMYENSNEILDNLLRSNEEIRKKWQKDFKLKDDPRITKIGRFLRRSSLDELPQLFNVLRGDMSLVGPRPIIQDEIAKYKEGYYYYQLVLPGITGMWQVSGRSNVDYKNRVKLDEWYVKNWSLWYDIVIILKTIIVVLTRKGAY